MNSTDDKNPPRDPQVQKRLDVAAAAQARTRVNEVRYREQTRQTTQALTNSPLGR